MTNQTTQTKTMNDHLSELAAVQEYGHADDGAGSVRVMLAASAGQDDLLTLQWIAECFGYAPVLYDVTDDATVWNLEVR